MNHDYWGEVVVEPLGFRSDIQFESASFNQKVSVWLGDDEEDSLSPAELDTLKSCYVDFLENSEVYISQLQSIAWARFLKFYTHQTLDINSIDEHNETLKNLLHLRVSGNNALRFVIAYSIDEEHGLEVLFVNGELVDIDGIGCTDI